MFIIEDHDDGTPFAEEHLYKTADHVNDHIYVEDGPVITAPNFNTVSKDEMLPAESILSSAGNSPPKGGNMFGSTTKMGRMLETQSSLQPKNVKTVKAFHI